MHASCFTAVSKAIDTCPAQAEDRRRGCGPSTHRLRISAALALAISLLAARARMSPWSDRPADPVRYSLVYPAAGAATVHVRLDTPARDIASHVLLIARAVPMGYGDEPFDRFVSHVVAFTRTGAAIAVTRGTGPRWNVGPAARVEYDVDVARMEQEILGATDSSRVRPRYASFLGLTVFGVLEDLETRPVDLRVHGPAGWRIYLTLAPDGSPAHADDFYALADSQVVMGPALRVERLRVPGGPPSWLALYAEGDADPARLAGTAREALEKTLAYFGSAPFPHYTVLLELLKPVSAWHEYGFGLEHLESFHTALNEAGDTSSLGLRYHIAHHATHAWIPKRAYGAGYFPFTWESSPKIDTIWFSEGFAQYAAIVALAASEEERQHMLDVRFRSVLENAAPEWQRMPLRALSLVASTQYAVDFRIGQLTFARGGLMATEMDDRIRERTHGNRSLRDGLRHLVAWSAANHRAFRVEDLPLRFQEATGVDTRDILDKWLARLPITR